MSTLGFFLQGMCVLLAFSLSLVCALPGLQFDEFLLVPEKKANVISLRLQPKTPKWGLLTVTPLT